MPLLSYEDKLKLKLVTIFLLSITYKTAKNDAETVKYISNELDRTIEIADSVSKIIRSDTTQKTVEPFVQEIP